MNLTEKPRYRGRPEIQNILSERILKPGNKFYFGQILNDDSLANMLGAYPESPNRRLINVTPNTMNYILWHILARGIADNLIKLTEEPMAGVFNAAATDKTIELTKKICNWPAAEAKDPKNLESIWLHFLKYDSPEEEFNIWRSFVLSEKFSLNGKAAASEMFYMMFMNPYFLLKQ